MKIEKGIPMPTSTGVGRTGKYPFGSMKIGDSFLADSNENNRLSSASAQWGHRHGGAKFTVRKVDGGYRCWRIK